MRQMDWQDFFDRAERQQAARARLIDELRVDERVKLLLHALDQLTDDDPNAKNLHNGTVKLSVPIDVIAWKIRVTGKTVKSYIDLAGATPYLAVSWSTHRSHTYLIRWPAIVDNGPGDETHAGGCHSENIAHGHGQVRGEMRSVRGGKGEESRGEISPQLPPEIPPSKTSLKKPVFHESDSKDPVFKTGMPGGKFPPSRSFAWWRLWREMIAQRDLSQPEDVDELYAFAVASGLMPDTQANRFRVFCQAVVDRRRSQRPGAIFRENVAWLRWYATCEDEDVAQQMIAIANEENEGTLPVVVRQQVHPDVEPAALADDDGPEPIPTNLTYSDEDTALRRQQQTQALLAKYGNR